MEGPWRLRNFDKVFAIVWEEMSRVREEVKVRSKGKTTRKGELDMVFIVIMAVKIRVLRGLQQVRLPLSALCILSRMSLDLI